MRRFVLDRNKDISGVSGTGIIADGVQFSDGQVVMSWRGKYHSIEIQPSIDQLMSIHGHEGATELKWIDNQQLDYACNFASVRSIVGARGRARE